MKLQKLIFQAGLALCCCYSACSQGPAKENNIKIIKEVPVKNKNSYYNNVALFLAGMKTDTVSPFNNLVNKYQWIGYSKSFDSIWKKVEEKSLLKIKNWSDTELADVNNQTKTLFYPFSGPDFLYATKLFPKANKYILFGLEKTGSVPDMKKLNDKTISGLFVSINKALEEILNSSFFITKQMSSELNNQDIDGVLPVIMLFMARTGNTVKDIRNANIGIDGKVIVADTFIVYKGANRYGKGVEISFSAPDNDTTIKKLYYFSADLTDQALLQNTGCKVYLQNLDTNVTTLIKSASYLLHNSLFTYVRNTILNKSKAVLQDDSGIAYHFFDKSKWNFQLYGTYEKPIQVFSYCYQKDLNAAYNGGSKAFNFKYGYGKGLNMLLAKKVINK
ncbi:MAG: hypothetical protein HGB12_06545 [Bacteroidetes bacterium]|nr:hypothetical protein [Bacteroidota bacterium]